MTQRRARARGAWTLGRIAGVEFRFSPTLIVAAVVLIGLFAPRLAVFGHSGYLQAAGFVLALYVSVFAHELAHLAVARMYGMEVESVTLHAMGGQTSIRGDTDTPAQEFWVSIVGPLATFAVAGIAWIVAAAAAGAAAAVLYLLVIVNVLIGLVNLLPGYPLDGGRVFRALVWALSGSRITGGIWASWAGRALAVAVIVVALLAFVLGLPVNGIDLVVAGLIAAFLWVGSSTGLEQAHRDRALSRISVRRLIEPAVPADAQLPALNIELAGAELLRAMSTQPSARYGVRDESGHLIGALTSDRVARAYKEGAS